MTSFTRTWNLTYESLPEDDDDALEGASRIRHTRQDISERMRVDHLWSGDSHDGKHNKVTLRPQTADPTLDPDDVALFGKAVGGLTELFFRPEGGAPPIQLSFSGGAPQAVPAGLICAFPGAVPSGFLECNGQAVSRTGFAGLFAACGTVYGAGDGSTTFNVPNLKGRTIFGLESAQNLLTAGVSGMTSTSLGSTGGNQNPQQHTHANSLSDGGHAHPGGRDASGPGVGPGWGVDVTSLLSSPANTGSSASNISLTNASSGSGSSGNVPPGMILRWIIKT